MDLPAVPVAGGGGNMEVRYKNVTADATAVTIRPFGGGGTIDTAATAMLAGAFSTLHVIQTGVGVDAWSIV